MRKDITILLSGIGMLLTVMCEPGAAQVSFKEFSQEYSIISDVSADGTVVVGVYDSPNTSGLFRWTEAGGLEVIGSLSSTSTNPRISRDGKTIIATVPDSRGCATAAIWQGGTNWKLLEPFPGVVPSEGNICTSAVAVSGDGSVVVGGAYLSTTKVVTFRWDAQNGMVNLGAFDEGTNSDSRPLAISADGKTVVGWDYKVGFLPPGPAGAAMNSRRGAIWWEGKERMIHAFGWAGEAWATNDVGSIIVGQFHPMDQFNNPLIRHGASTYKYTAWNGQFHDLGAVPVPIGEDQRNYLSQPFAVSDDGLVIVGESGWVEKLAMIWTPRSGMLLMKDYLTLAGVKSHAGWYLIRAHWVSPDGRVVVGYGQKIGGGPSIRSWIATLR